MQILEKQEIKSAHAKLAGIKINNKERYWLLNIRFFVSSNYQIISYSRI